MKRNPGLTRMGSTKWELPKPYIDTFMGKAYYHKTCIENKYGNWDDHWYTGAGEFVIHEGKKHHVYIVKRKK